MKTKDIYRLNLATRAVVSVPEQGVAYLTRAVEKSSAQDGPLIALRDAISGIRPTREELEKISLTLLEGQTDSEKQAGHSLRDALA